MTIIYIVHQPGWEGGFDSAWSTQDLAAARADELDPTTDKDGVLWGILTKVTIDSDPEAEDYVEGIDRLALRAVKP